MTMKELLKAYESKRPEVVFEWQDAETDACGWVVINSLGRKYTIPKHPFV